MDCVYDRSNKDQTTRPDSGDGDVLPLREAKPPTSIFPINSDASSVESRDRRYLELRLLHVWNAYVAPTFPGCYDPENLHAWSAEIPRLAFEYEPLLTAIFSISLLYMALRSTSLNMTNDELFAHRARYFEVTLQDHRKALSAMDRYNADAIGFTSLVLVFDAFASLRERQFHDIKPYKPPTEWLHMCRGVRHIVSLGLDMVGEDPNSTLRSMAAGSTTFFDPGVIFCESNRARFPYLLEPHGEEVESNADNEAYGAAVAYIGSVLAGKEAGDVPLKLSRRLTIFPILLQTRFLTLLEMQRPRAMVILAHYFALALSLSELWWIGDSPAREIAAIEASLDPAWLDLMAWPLQVLGESGS